MYSLCLEHAFMIWFRSANSHRGPQLHRCIRGRTDGSIRLCANLLQKPLALGGASTDEYTPFCNGPASSRFCPWSARADKQSLGELRGGGRLCPLTSAEHWPESQIQKRGCRGR